MSGLLWLSLVGKERQPCRIRDFRRIRVELFMSRSDVIGLVHDLRASLAGPA